MEEVAINPNIELPELTQDWGNRLLGHKQNTVHTRTQEKRAVTPMPKQDAAGPRLRWRLLDTQASLDQSLVGSWLLSPGYWCAHGFVCALQESVSPVLCKFWQLYVWVNGDLLQECLCHTQVCGTQSPCPCGRPLLACTSTGDIPTQFCLSLCGVSGSWAGVGGTRFV